MRDYLQACSDFDPVDDEADWCICTYSQAQHQPRPAEGCWRLLAVPACYSSDGIARRAWCDLDVGHVGRSHSAVYRSDGARLYWPEQFNLMLDGVIRDGLFPVGRA